MNNILPNEVLHQIFIQIPWRQRLTCMLVCRYWCNILRRRSLLHDVHLAGDVELNSFIDMIQRLGNRGSQVEILKIRASDFFDKRKLCNMLPNLRVFEFENTTFSDRGDKCWKPFEFINSDSKLEEITDNGGCEFTRQLLKSNACSRLTRLDLKLALIYTVWSDLFDDLRHAPNLKELALYFCEIGIEYCEKLHKYLPKLEILELNSVSMKAGSLPHEVIPATSVTTFFASIDDAISCPDWYMYLAKKYTNLKSYDFHDYDFCDTNSAQIMRVYQDGIIPLYKNIGHNIHHFTAARTPSELNVFATLDEFGLQFTRFDLQYNDKSIFTQLAQSNQSKSVTELDLTYTKIASPSLLGNFTSLRQIDIDMNEGDRCLTINLTDYLNALPPSVTSFCANCVAIEITGMPKRKKNIKVLNIGGRELSKDLCKIVSTYFPKLNDLVLKGLVTEDLDIELPKNHFVRFWLETEFNTARTHGFSMKTADKRLPEYYIKRDHSEDARPATTQELQDRVMVNVVIASAKDISLETLRYGSDDDDDEDEDDD